MKRSGGSKTARPMKVVISRPQAKLNDRQKKQVKRLVSSGLTPKYITFNLAATGILASGSISTNLMPIAQDDTVTGRSGDSVKLRSMEYKLSFIAGDTTNFMRIILFRWHLDVAITAASIGDILENTVTNPFSSLLNQNSLNEGRFSVVMDKYISLNTAGEASKVIQGKIFGRRLGKKKLTFNTGATTGKDQFFFLFVSDSAAAPNPTAAISVLTHYTD